MRKKAPKPLASRIHTTSPAHVPGTTTFADAALCRAWAVRSLSPTVCGWLEQIRGLGFKRGALVTDPQIMSTDLNAAEAADAAARTVLRLLAVGDIDIVWALLHEDFRRAVVEDFLAMSCGPRLRAAHAPRLHRAQFLNLPRQRLLNALGPLPSAEAERRVRTVDMFAADDCVVVTLEVEGEPSCRWAIEMTLTEVGWRWRNLATDQ